jgi:putative ABC transport system permease protein
MRLIDLIGLILDNLGRRKARVALTAIGVVIGTASVVVLVSLGIGLQMNATQSLYGISDLTQIQVYPRYEDPMAASDGKPARSIIDDTSVEELSAIPGVLKVVPRDYIRTEAILKSGRMETWANIIGIPADAMEYIGVSASQGTAELTKGTIVVGALVSQNFYDPNWRPGQDPPVPPDLYDQTLRLQLTKYDDQGNQTKKSLQVYVAGVLAESRGESDWSVYMSIDDLNKINEWALGRRINRSKDGYSYLTVKVQDVDQVLDITEQISNLGYEAYSPQSYVQGINSFFVIIQIMFGGVGAISLLVAAIGIANTMAMAILERTREIGLMKAIGATNRDVLSVFLGEAAGIGFIGGLGGVLVGWVAGQILNVLALSYLAGQAAQQGGAPPTQAVFTPLWLPVGTLLFAVLIGLASGVYPALRAATLVPVNALKYE